MSFLDDILDVGGKLWQGFTGPGVAGGVARATALGYLLKQVTSSINKDNQKPSASTTNTPDPGVRLQVDPDTQHAIPVIYGTAFIGGIVTDAVLTNSNQTMWYCLTLCEKTGNLISGIPSQISFEEIYIDDARVFFNADGRSVARLVDEDGVQNTDVNGLITIYCYAGNSTTPVVPKGYTMATTPSAFSLFPNWTSNHTMSDLVFVLVRIDYNRDKGVTNLPQISVKLKNTMEQPGDVLFDYMTNTRYGAGINPTEIYSA